MSDEDLIEKLKYLGLTHLSENWDNLIKNASSQHQSYQRLLQEIVEKEYELKTERARKARIKRAKIPEIFVMETFPFRKQPKLKKRIVLNLYDSLAFMNDGQDLIFIGPTGCGKTGLATAFLIHAINQGSKGLFVDFSELIHTLYQFRGDHSEETRMRKLASYEVLLIDELGYASCNREQASLFFDLMRRRHKRQTTIITTQLGFEEWGNFLQDAHLTAALLDRITVNCAVFNMKDCISIRPKKIVYATNKKTDQEEQESSP